MSDKEVKEDVKIEDVVLKDTTELYILLFRTGDSYWYSVYSYKTEDEIRQGLSGMSYDAYKIIKVSELPIKIAPGLIKKETP